MNHSAKRAEASLAEMIGEDLVAERVAIGSYKQMIAFIGEDDPATRRLFEWILRPTRAGGFDRRQ